MANRNFMEENLRRLEQELLDHKRNLTLPGITNEERMRLLIAVRDVEREILSTRFEGPHGPRELEDVEGHHYTPEDEEEVKPTEKKKKEERRKKIITPNRT